MLLPTLIWLNVATPETFKLFVVTRPDMEASPYKSKVNLGIVVPIPTRPFAFI